MAGDLTVSGAHPVGERSAGVAARLEESVPVDSLARKVEVRPAPVSGGRRFGRRATAADRSEAYYRKAADHLIEYPQVSRSSAAATISPPLATGPIVPRIETRMVELPVHVKPLRSVDSCVAVTCGACGNRGPARLATMRSTHQFGPGERDHAGSGFELESAAESKRRCHCRGICPVAYNPRVRSITQ